MGRNERAALARLAVTRAPATPSTGALRAVQPPRWAGLLYWTSAASIIGGLVLWEIAGRFFVKKALFLTTPTQIVAETGKLIANGKLQVHVVTSGLEFVLG